MGTHGSEEKEKKKDKKTLREMRRGRGHGQERNIKKSNKGKRQRR